MKEVKDHEAVEWIFGLLQHSHNETEDIQHYKYNNEIRYRTTVNTLANLYLTVMNDREYRDKLEYEYKDALLQLHKLGVDINTVK